MRDTLQALRTSVYPRAFIGARGGREPVRASDIILGMTLVMGLVVSLARTLTHLFAAA